MNPEKKFSHKDASSRVKKIALILSLSLVGMSSTTVISAILGYDAFFPRYERPDYNLYPGMYCIDRYDGTLPRQTLKVRSGEHDLASYYYPVDDPKGLCVVVHGIHAGADDYLPIIEAVTKEGYAVFAYDATGNYDSEGDSGIGMCQQLVDLDRVLSYLGSTYPYADMPKLLIGHSWGGYAVSSVLSLHREIRACVCIAPMRDGTTVMADTAEQYAGEAVDAVRPVFDVYQKYLFGSYIQYNAIVGINSTDIPVLIAQGMNDMNIPHDTLSITARLDEITNPNVRLYYGTELQGSHTGIWHSARAQRYAAQIKRYTRGMSDEEKAEYYKTVDHRLYSEVNDELMQLIFETFENGLK